MPRLWRVPSVIALLFSAAVAYAQSPFAPKVMGPLSQRVVAYQIDAKYAPDKFHCTLRS